MKIFCVFFHQQNRNAEWCDSKIIKQIYRWKKALSLIKLIVKSLIKLNFL